VAAEQARLDEVRTDMGQVVAAAYRRGSSDRLVSLVAGTDPTTFLQRASMLDRVARSQADVLAEVSTARHRVATQQDAADRELAALREAEQQLAERRSAIEAALAEQQRLLDGLQEAERRRVEAAREAAVAAPVAARASRSVRGAAPAASGSSSVPEPAAASAPAPAAPSYDGPAEGRARTAVEEAHRQLGTPYRYGGNGPDNFDCSGLTSWVWRAAGVSLPRTSRDQYAQGRKVPRADIQPGDLLYFGSPIHHVGVYIGNGQMISAPRTGDRVKMQAAFRSDFVGATRPGA
jgi:cell wall-associated NlpC family hydrolase